MPCRRCACGCVEKHEFATRSMAKRKTLKGHSQLSTCPYGCVSFNESCSEHRKSWSHELLQAPPDAGPAVNQAITGLPNWMCAGRTLVQIGGRLPTAKQLHQSFLKILSKNLAANKKVSFAFQQKASNMLIMNPSPTEIVCVEVALVQYAKVAGHLPGVAAAATCDHTNSQE